MCSPCFDRAPLSRDIDCYSLTKISEILGGRQRFGMCQRLDHFECGGPVQTGRYSTGESPPIKAGHRELLPHFESTCTRFNTSVRRRMRPSAGPERSQQLQILPSLTVRQFFSGCAYFSCYANIPEGAGFPSDPILSGPRQTMATSTVFTFVSTVCTLHENCGQGLGEGGVVPIAGRCRTNL